MYTSFGNDALDRAEPALPVGTRVEVEVIRLDPRFAVVRTLQGETGLLHKGAMTRAFFVRDPADELQIGERYEVEVDGATFSGLIAFSLVRLDGVGLRTRRSLAERYVQQVERRLDQLGWQPFAAPDRSRLVRLVMQRGEQAVRATIESLLGGELLLAVLNQVESRLQQDAAGAPDVQPDPVSFRTEPTGADSPLDPYHAA